MDDPNLNDVEKWIAEDEGLKLHPYLDTVGKSTIGYGRNLSDNGISKDEALYMMRNDIALCKKQLAYYSWYYESPLNVQKALINMCYNMGINRLLKFHDMIKFLSIKDYDNAANSANESEWAKEVGHRATEIERMMSSKIQTYADNQKS